MDKANLYAGGKLDHRFFVTKIADLALIDHMNKAPLYRSGKQLCDMFSNDYRKGHIRLASTIYNKLRWSLSLADEERNTG